MTTPLQLLTDRGFIQDVSDPEGLAAAFDSGRVTFYVGFDPTSSSLHIGHLMGVMAMAHLQRAGHRPIAVAGGGTARIGDPSFRDDERVLLDDASVEANLVGYRDQLGRILDLSSSEAGLLVDNYSWLGSMGFIGFLRDVGKHFSVNQMIARESVRRRLEEREQGISFTEFAYQLLQAYDFAHLFESEGCILQLGGSDQWGNITAGIDLTRRIHGGQAFGAVWPLIERSDGQKMSASTGEALWLAPDQTSPYAYYQWFFNVPDADAGKFLKLFTFLDLDEIAGLEAEAVSNPAGRATQRALAAEATRIAHGDEGLAAAESATVVLFGDEPFTDLDDVTLNDAFGSAPSVSLPRADIEAGIETVDLMVLSGAAASKSEARRLVSQGAVRVNNTLVADDSTVLGTGSLAGTATVVVKVGKKRYFLARFDA